jgi:NAD(P)-dependent dehydrogenase (short-subunit alcohol dehydrogenase family)
MANAFADGGADVWVTDVDDNVLADCPVNWQVSAVSAADEVGMAAVFADLANRWGGVDVICANAGIAGPTARVEDVALGDWRRCVSVNLEGAFLACKYAAPMMKDAGTGSIVFTSSTAGVYGYPNRAPYAGG